MNSAMVRSIRVHVAVAVTTGLTRLFAHGTYRHALKQ